MTCTFERRDHWESSGVSLVKPLRPRGIGVSHEKDLYHKDVLNERLVKLKYESYQKVYYIDKTVTRITYWIIKKLNTTRKMRISGGRDPPLICGEQHTQKYKKNIGKSFLQWKNLSFHCYLTFLFNYLFENNLQQHLASLIN